MRQPCLPLLLAGVAAALAVLAFPVGQPRDDLSPNAFAAEVLPEGNLTWRLYYDAGAGFSGPLRRDVPMEAARNAQRLWLGLPSGRLTGLRLEPMGLRGPVSLHDARIVGADGRVLLRIQPEDFRVYGGVKSLVRENGGIRIVPESESAPADVRIALRLPLNLPCGIPPPHGPTVARERALAALLAAVGAALAAAHVRRGKGETPRWLAASAVGFAALAVLFFRRPDAIANPQFWCEDGTLYFLGQRTDGWKALLETGNSYLVLLPRLTAGLASLAPVYWAPALYLLVAVAVTAAAAVKAASPRVGLPFPAWAGLAVVLIPNMDEIAGNLTNAQWYGAVLLVLVALSRPARTWSEAARDAVIVVLFGLTGPFIVFLWPVFLWRALRLKTSHAWTGFALCAFVAALQIAAFILAPSQIASHPPFQPLEMLAASGYRTGGQLLAAMPSPDFASPLPLGIAGLVFFALLWLVFPLRTSWCDARPALALAAAGMIAGGLLRYAGQAEFFFLPVYIVRYFCTPLLFALWLLLGGLARGGWRRWAAAMVLAAVAWRNAPGFRMAPYTDRDWPGHAREIEAGKAVHVPIDPPDWGFDCPP